MSMRRRFLTAGLAGLGLAVVLSVLGWILPTIVPPLLSASRLGDATIPRLLLLALGLIAVSELPLMLIVMVRLARRPPGTQNILDLTHLAYVAFPAVYGILGAVLTGEQWWVVVMFLLCILRLIMSVLGVQVPPPLTTRR